MKMFGCFVDDSVRLPNVTADKFNSDLCRHTLHGIMDAAPSAQSHGHEYQSWHPTMRPNSQNPDEANGKPAGQLPLTPLHFPDNQCEEERLNEPLEGLKNGEQPQGGLPLPIEEDDQVMKSAECMAQSDSRLVHDAHNSANDTNEQRERIRTPKNSLSGGMPDEAWEGAGVDSDMSESYPRSGPIQEIQSHNVLEENIKARREFTAPREAATNLNPTGSTLQDQEEMAKAWESAPSCTGHSRPGDVSRSNSFPQVPPLPETGAFLPQPLPHSQAEDIMQEDEQSLGSMNHLPSVNSLSAADPNPDAQQPASCEMNADVDENSTPSTNAAYTTHPTLLADEESRFEEGLPLMHAPEQLSTKARANNSLAFEAHDGEDDDGFFHQTHQPFSDEATSLRPQALDRKSTIQVLDGLHYVPHSIAHGESQGAVEQPSSETFTEGKVAASLSVANSQSQVDQQTKTNQANPKDEDLAELWKAALGDDDLLEENEDSLDPSSFFEDDGEGFLEDGGEEEVANRVPVTDPNYGTDGSVEGYGQIKNKQSSSRDKYQPDSVPQPFKAHSKKDYGHINGAPTNQSMAISSTLNNSVPDGRKDTDKVYSHATQTSSRPHMPPSTQSFADKAKGGYTSPYDLPMDVVRPKKRSAHQQLRPNSDAQVAPARPLPPRSSSMFTGALPSLDAEPPVLRLPSAMSHASTRNGLPTPLKASPSMSTFFEELPVSKPRPPSSMGRVAHPTSQPTPPTPLPSQHDLSQHIPPTQQPVSASTSASQQYQLLPPERMSLYPSASQSESGKQSLPAANVRYSPTPVHQSNVAPPRTRYAASPLLVGRPAPSQTLSFQPRTSSPLAQNSSLPRGSHQPSIPDPPLHQQTSSGRETLSTHNSVSSSSFPNYQDADLMEPTVERTESTDRFENNLQFRSPPSPVVFAHQGPLSNPASDSSYALNTPDADHTSSDGSSLFQRPQELPIYATGASDRGLLPRRSQSQSPDTSRYKPELVQSMQNQHQRPASVNNHTSLPSAETALPLNQMHQRARTFSKDLNYIRPSDGRETDNLERWKGCPIINFGFGGTIVTSFPKHVPRYAAGQSTPVIKCSPGEVKIQDGKILPLTEDVATFPGPLRSKSKKKEVLDWLQRRITHLERSGVDKTSSATLPDPIKRYDEKILLWKIMRIMIEHDGAFDGNPSAENAVRSVLSPQLTVGDTASLPSQSFNSPLLGISRNGGSRSSGDLVNPEAMEDLRKLLLHGEREKAVWHAVDSHLWAHAMLIASTLEKNVWRQVSQEFVRQEVKTFGNNTESLAALYQIFAGNWEESMDELVPPSARAGLQLISKTANTGPTKNALDGLDRWRETLTLILSNRSVDDGRALVSLGKLLAGYGRIEAAHICYIFAKSPGLIGGPDDSQMSVALLGADHLQQPFDYGRDLDCILLTEVYDFALTLLASSSAATILPHLQSYKLYHAMILAEYGYKTEAQQYCEMVTSALNSTTRRSPYYHYLLFGALEDLVDRLRQAPRDNSGSWISKPSIDKVSGSIWAKFNQYVAGDEGDAVSTASGKAFEQDPRPFAKLVNDSPNLSRTPSSSDMFSAYAPAAGVSQMNPVGNFTNSRYAPSGLYTPRSSSEQAVNSSQDYLRPMNAQKDSLRPGFAPQPPQQNQSRPVSSNGSLPESFKPATQPSSYTPHTESYLPTPPSQSEYMPVAPPEDLSTSFYQEESYQQTPPLKPEPSHEDYQPSTTTYKPPSYTYDPHSANYDQPTPTSSYDPPAYDPYGTKAGDSPVEEKTKKKSFMDIDEDDDFEARAAALRKEEKAKKDREADEAFKRAAEADGMYSHTFIFKVI